jgi:PleD family two-component response regulator
MSAAPAKVLVIDDERPIRKLLRMGLSTQGYEILEAPDGKTALDLLALEPDMVILDLGLPDVKGLDLLKTIRQRNESVPIVVLSSRSDEAGKVEALDLGADDYVTAWTNCWRGCAPRCGINSTSRASVRCSASAILRSIWCAASSRCTTAT